MPLNANCSNRSISACTQWTDVRDIESAILETVRRKLEVGDARVADLHPWKTAPSRRGFIDSLVTGSPKDTTPCRSPRPWLQHEG